MLNRFKSVTLYLIVLFLSFGTSTIYGQEIKVLTELDYYTFEETANVLVYLPPGNVKDAYEVQIKYNDSVKVPLTSIKPGLNKFSFPIKDLPVGKNMFLCQLSKTKSSEKVITFPLIKRPPKYNEVKINRASGGLIVDGLPFFPYGFYCYSPVQPTLAEEEVVRGFNMMSPYQTIDNKTLKERRNYMDRCANLGMKVHYNLLRVSGGGGVGFRLADGNSEEEKRKLLINEINEFKDHPALLGWYISDEPVGQGVPPEPLEEMYKLIKTLDPYHPVSIVFMTPSKARKYENAMDIVMADPYPIPNNPVTDVSRVARRLVKEFYLEKSVWIVPQSFGGNEWWRREPTGAEMRAMTYQALVEGAKGIQYFVRHGMNAFPKSVVAWNECSNIAHEVAELTPDLTMGTPWKSIKSNNKDVRLLAIEYADRLSILAVNVKNQPVRFKINLPPLKKTKKAEVLFENRKVDIKGNKIDDFIDGFGTRIYRIDLSNDPGETDSFHEENMVLNPGFEQIFSTGVPSGSYARIRGDRGATYFVDSRVAYQGSHSLRLVTPEKSKGIGLSFFPVPTGGGNSYTVSVWAKARPVDPYWEAFEPNALKRLFRRSVLKDTMPKFKLSLDGYGTSEFDLTTDWEKYSISAFIGNLSSGSSRLRPILELTSAGTAWFDKLEVYPDMSAKTEIVDSVIELTIKNINGGGVIHYTLDGFEPVFDSPVYTHPIVVSKSSLLKVRIFKGQKPSGRLTKAMVIHDALGKSVSIKNGYSSRYTAGGKNALTDGQLASRYYRDGLWQGYSGKDMVAVIDLKNEISIEHVAVTFLQNLDRDIFLPYKVHFEISSDGKQYTEIYYSSDSRPKRDPGPFRAKFENTFKDITARYIKVVAKGYGTVPDWLPTSSGNAWLFVDEIVVNKK